MYYFLSCIDPPIFSSFSNADFDAISASIFILFLISLLPKRGFKSLLKKNTAILNLSKIQKIIDKSKNEIKTVLDLKILKEKNLVNKKFKKLKILGTGEIKKNIEISAHFASKQALSKIEKAGGKISIVKK